MELGKNAPATGDLANATGAKWTILRGHSNRRISVHHRLQVRSCRLPTELVSRLLSLQWPALPVSRFRLRSINHAGVMRSVISLSRNPRLKTFKLAALSGYSLRGLNKAFRTHLGCTPGAVIMVVRLWNAVHLLANSDLPLDTIATRCGYKSINSLYVAFRRDLGITPLSLRQPSPPRVSVPPITIRLLP
jgi:AraC-like DNA-binding protein